MEPSSSCFHSSGSSDCTAGFSCAGEIYPKHSFLPRSTDAGKKRSGAMGPSSMFYVHDADVEVTHHFLEECSLCAKALSGDIFMYRGDTPFCSEECRQQQIEVDRAKHRRKKRAVALAASARKEQRQQQQPPRKQSSQRIPIWA